MDQFSSIIFNIAQSVPGFLLAIVAHEAAHGYMANYWGDPTAKNAGRLTLNPMVHYDPFGTVLFPLISAVTGFAIIGWAKPVPIDIRNFKKFRLGLFWVSFAGPLANFIIGTLSALGCALVVIYVPMSSPYYPVFIGMLKYSVSINFILAFFNLIPLPPLDGSKMVSSFLKGRALYQYEALAQYTPMIFLAILMLSFVGVSVLGYVLAPALEMTQGMILFFLRLFGAFA